MNNELETYLNDHLSAATGACDLLTWCAEEYGADALDGFLEWLTSQIEEDRKALKHVMAALGTEESATKKATGWVAAKASRVKFSDGHFGLFEAMESLSTGVYGKTTPLAEPPGCAH